MDFSRTFLLQTVVSNPGYMKDNFYITIETFHIADRGEKENVHELDKKALKDRQVVFFMCLDSKVVFPVNLLGFQDLTGVLCAYICLTTTSKVIQCSHSGGSH